MGIRLGWIVLGAVSALGGVVYATTGTTPSSSAPPMGCPNLPKAMRTITQLPDKAATRQDAIRLCQNLSEGPKTMTNYLVACLKDASTFMGPGCEALHKQNTVPQASECARNVSGIRTAQIAYDAAFDKYVPVTKTPNRVPDRNAVSWPSGTNFDTLGWGPDGKVRGVYWVDVKPDGTDFTAHGLCDVDGDGNPTLSTATKNKGADVPAKKAENPAVVHAKSQANRPACGPDIPDRMGALKAFGALDSFCVRLVDGSWTEDAKSHLVLSCLGDIKTLAHTPQCQPARDLLGVDGAMLESMRLHAMRAECPSNVDGIKTAQIAYDAAFDTYIAINSYKPRSMPGKDQVSWVSGTDFDTLGWLPDGKVRGVYRVTSRSSTDFLVEAKCDVDGDGIPSYFTATKSINTTMNTPADVY
jgi:hypothetical protein